MNKYLHITLVLGLLVSFGLSAKSNPEKGEPVKPNAKRAIVAVPAQNVLEQQAMEALNAQLKGLSISESSNFVPSANFLADYAVSAPTKSNRDSANALFKRLEQLGKMPIVTRRSKTEIHTYEGRSLRTARGGNNWHVESVAQILKEIGSNPTKYNKNTVTAFDGRFGTLANEAADLSCANCRYDMIVNGVKVEFKSASKTLIAGIPTNTAFHNQHRAYLESGPPIEYIFEAGKIPTPFTAGIRSKEEFVRKQFLEMYKQNTAYFSSNIAITEFWSKIRPDLIDLNSINLFLQSQSHNSTWLNFIKVK